MKSVKSRLLAQLLFAFAAAVACVTAAVAASASPTVPFQAVITINEQAGVDTTGTCPGMPELGMPPFAGQIAGTGTASHLGKVTSRSSDCILLVGPSAFYFYSTQFTLTAANGDKLYGSYHGALVTTPGNPVPQISGTFQIVDGTGRFAGATGKGVIDGFENIDFTTGQGQGQIRLTGTISY